MTISHNAAALDAIARAVAARPEGLHRATPGAREAPPQRGPRGAEAVAQPRAQPGARALSADAIEAATRIGAIRAEAAERPLPRGSLVDIQA